MKRLRPAIVALAVGGAVLAPGVAAAAHGDAAARGTPAGPAPTDPRQGSGSGHAKGREDVRVAGMAPGVLAGPDGLPRGTFARDIPLPRATYKYSHAVRADLVVVFKGRRLLHLMKDGEVVGSYRIALGFEARGHKLREGDGRTPEGVYTIDWRNPNSRFHRSLHISYPAPRDLGRAGRLGFHPGRDIMIHGLPNDRDAAAVGHPYRDWTEGCIAVTSEEMDDIWARVDDGTPIIIYP